VPTDDAGDRTEQPTPRRLEEAREEGRIPRSLDLSAAIVLLGGLLLLKLLGGHMLAALLNGIHAVDDGTTISAAELPAWIRRVSRAAAEALAPLLLLLVILAACGTIAQSGLPTSLKALALNLNRLNPVVGLKRLWSADSAVRLAMGLLKMAFVAAIAYLAIAGDIRAVLQLGNLAPAEILPTAGGLIYRGALRMGLALLVLGLLDYLYQRWSWWRGLKMTRQEIRDELKRMEGDPHIRTRRRQMQLRLAMQRIGLDVPKSDVVVTNPTEYAVALKYDEATMNAPKVVAKGQDLLALRIRQIAQQHGIPIVQRPPLARALYYVVEVGQEIPPAFYRAVAEVLAYVYRITGRAPALAAGR